MVEDLISKKELLESTGISYGQLYRWKRGKLIPESWFIKQATVTGQETFFPKGKILGRIDAILRLKKNKSLDDLTGLFSPGKNARTFTKQDIRAIPNFSPTLPGLFEKVMQKDVFTFRELIFIYIVNGINSEFRIDRNDIEDMAASVRDWLPKMKINSCYKLLLCMRYSQPFILLTDEGSRLHIDIRCRILKEYYLDDVSREINMILYSNLAI